MKQKKLPSIRIHKVDRVSGAVGVWAGGVVLLGEGIGGEPAAEGGAVVPGAEVGVGHREVRDTAYFKEPL